MKFSEMPYTRVNIEEITAKMQDLAARLRAAKSGEEAFAVHQEQYKATGDVSTAINLCFIRHSINTEDAFYKAEQEYYDEVMPLLQGVALEYNKALYECPFREYLVSKIGPVVFKNIEIAMKSFDEKLIPLMQEENALTTRYNNLIASAKIEFSGEVTNISGMNKYTTAEDREVRKAAWKALSDHFMTITDQLDEIYDALVKNRTAQARMMGYENFVELGYYRMNRNCYDRDMVENFRSQMKQYFIPFAEELHEQRRKSLGLDKLKYYDNGVFFKEGNPKPTGTPEEILEAGRQMYRELSPETGEFIDFMLENELFDVLGRMGKQAGGYMTFIANYKSPFVFANFNGTSGDVDVITHECGHAFQGYLTRNEEIAEVRDITMETAEIHSMSMEYFTYGWMDRFFGDRSADYLKMHFADSAVFVPYGCMVDEFQHRVYEQPDLTPAERKQLWKDLEAVYRPYMDYEDDPFFGNGSFWQRQQHIFNSPFYYIDYVLASICAMQFKVKMDKDYDAAWADYLKLCRLSARDFFVNMIKEAGLRVPFEDGSIEPLVNDLRKIV